MEHFVLDNCGEKFVNDDIYSLKSNRRKLVKQNLEVNINIACDVLQLYYVLQPRKVVLENETE